MTLDLIDVEAVALTKHLLQAIDRDPLSVRSQFEPLKAIPAESPIAMIQADGIRLTRDISQ
jgi:hypothetical protein